MQKFGVTDIDAALAYFDRWGYVVFRDAFDQEVGQRFWAKVEQAIAGNDELTYSLYGQLYTGPNVPLEGKRLPRIIDIESHVPEARELMLTPAVVDFLRRLYDGANPTCLQTLTYKYSSEQGAHSDKLLVAPLHAHDYDRETLAAAWFALQPSNPENGALIVYPGSHKLPKPDLNWEIASEYGANVRALDAWCRDRGSEPQVFEAETGDILFWHGDLVHAGGPITSETPEPPTRRSLVCHYAKVPTRARSWDPGFLRVRYKDASYYHKRPYLPALARSWFDRFREGPRIG